MTPMLDDYEPGETAAALAPLLAQLRDALIRLLDGHPGEQPAARTGRWCTGIFRWRRPGALRPAGGREASATTSRRPPGPHGPPLFHAASAPGTCASPPAMTSTASAMAFFGVLHETGHALYDQGLPVEHWGTPRGDAVSLGIHESQSRMWENLVGRSLGFWQFFYPRGPGGLSRPTATWP